MRVAGIGFRADAPLTALQAALEAAGPADALATRADKAAAPQMQALARATGRAVHAIAPDLIAAQATITQSPRQRAAFGTGSLAEAAALAALAPGAQIVTPRVVTACGRATAAIAEGEPR